jgi:hypothetical protein
MIRPDALLEEVIAAHGGADRWRRAEAIEGAFSSGGLAFASRLQPFALRGLRVSVAPHRRVLGLTDYCKPGWQGIWTPDKVEIRDTGDRTVASRSSPRASLMRASRKLFWDKLDLLYFAGYALWNYLSFPFLLLEPGVSPVDGGTTGETGQRWLKVRFDEALPTHSPVQVFHFDRSGLLLRHDYTADVIGRFAAAANFCGRSESIDGLRFYTRRRVLPRLPGGRVLAAPTLVWIRLDGLAVRDARTPG